MLFLHTNFVSSSCQVLCAANIINCNLCHTKFAPVLQKADNLALLLTDRLNVSLLPDNAAATTIGSCDPSVLPLPIGRGGSNRNVIG